MKLFTPKPRTVFTTKPTDPRLAPDLVHEMDITLGLSFIREYYLPAPKLAGGWWSTLTIDNCIGLSIENASIDPDGKYGIAIADNSGGIWLDGVLFENPAKRAEIIIGHRPGMVPSSDWHHTGSVALRDLRRSDGGPVRVELWDCDEPMAVNCPTIQFIVRSRRRVKFEQWRHKKGLLP